MTKKHLKYAFRITHIDNIPHIIQYGLTTRSSPRRNDKYVAIGDPQVIDIRKRINFQGVDISECIPFYFGPRSPMLYVIQNGYNGVKRQNAEDIVYCVLRLDEIIKKDLECIFSDGHALSALTEFYDKDRLKNIDTIIDYDDVYATYWASEADIDLKRRKEAELLIKSDIPAYYIRGFVVYNNKARTTLLNLGIQTERIHVSPDFYF